jgi:uncharacterized protein YbbK (DUF523 family)/uncharacterized protein YbgA (DUF1722 family)
MDSRVKPLVVISKCLEHAPCRWNGHMIQSRTVRQLKPYVRFIPVCPETEIGLGVPRKPLHLVQVEDTLHLIQRDNRADLSGKMHEFINRFIKKLPPVDGFILKANSPSCGYKDVKIFAAEDHSSPLFNKGNGFFSAAVQKHFPNQAIQTETGLDNLRLREHFFIKLFTWARFALLKLHPCLKDLKGFHSTYKYLIMSYSQTKFKKLEMLAANVEQNSLARVFSEYERELNAVFSRPPSFQTQARAFEQLLSCSASQVSSKEKALFTQILDSCRLKKKPLAACRDQLHSWVRHIKSLEPAVRVLFFPYPWNLFENTKQENK